MKLCRMTMLVIFLSLLGAGVALAEQEGRLSQAAAQMVGEMSGQINDRFAIDGLSVVVTTPVEITSLDRSSALARQLQEELTRCLVSAGYRVQELRKGQQILMRAEQGEFLLTRKQSQLAKKSVKSNLALVGTYAQSGQAVRFNLRLIDTVSGEIYAMSSATVPLSGDLRALALAQQRPAGSLASQGRPPSAASAGVYGAEGSVYYGANVNSGYLSGGYSNYEPSVITRLP